MSKKGSSNRKLSSMGFDKVFDAQFDLLCDKENEQNPKFLMDKYQVSGILPKKKGITEWLKTNFSVIESNYPSGIKKGFTADSIISIDFLLNALNVLRKFDDKVRIRLGKDYPISLETNEMRFIIAPRIDNGNKEESIALGYEGIEEVKKEEGGELNG